MPKTTKKTTRTRSKVKGLPKAQRELAGEQARRVKGGVIDWGDGTAEKKASVKDGTSNTIVFSESTVR